jgi:hypothetical protein
MTQNNPMQGTKITKKSIREFIYLDVAKLYSLYSQVFEGITSQITDEKLSQLVTGDSQGSILMQATAESKAVEASRRIENRILHDHMYTRLELALDATLIDALDIKYEQIEHLFLKNPIIKISGRAEIEDYERIGTFMGQFNVLGEAIAYATLISSTETKEQKKKLEDRLLQESNGQRKKAIENELAKLVNAKILASNMGLIQDEKMLQNLKMFSDMFNPEGYNVVITSHNRPNVHFRGVVDRTWLRSSPALNSSLYGGQSESPWSMVGMVTSIPGTYRNLSKDAENSELPNELLVKRNIDENPTMLDAYRNMFRAARTFERMFIESDKEIEIVLSPLAIYREFDVNISNK